MLKKKAQSTLEYLIILSAFIAAVVLFSVYSLNPKMTSILTEASENMTEKVYSDMQFSQF